MVDKAALDEVHPARRLIPREDAAREADHVVHVACLAILRAELTDRIPNGIEVLVIGMTARCERTRLGDRVPERLGRGPILALPGRLVERREADDLRRLRIRMKPIQAILALQERIEDAMMAELVPRRVEIALVAGILVELDEGLVEPAPLRPE